jgi:response regulator RpfG family c-di-GMP phosphodiesterase
MNILLVDDHDVESLSSLLEMRDYRVQTAKSLQGAMDVLLLDQDDPQCDPVHVVITDYDLGPLSNGDGDQLLAAVKRNWPTIGTCLWSGLDRPPCDAADLQITKMDIDDLLDWLREEALIHGE